MEEYFSSLLYIYWTRQPTFLVEKYFSPLLYKTAYFFGAKYFSFIYWTRQPTFLVQNNQLEGNSLLFWWKIFQPTQFDMLLDLDLNSSQLYASTYILSKIFEIHILNRISGLWHRTNVQIQQHYFSSQILTSQFFTIWNTKFGPKFLTTLCPYYDYWFQSSMLVSILP